MEKWDAPEDYGDIRIGDLFVKIDNEFRRLKTSDIKTKGLDLYAVYGITPERAVLMAGNDDLVDIQIGPYDCEVDDGQNCLRLCPKGLKPISAKPVEIKITENLL